MKKLILILVLLGSFTFAQNWTSIKETNVWVGTALDNGVDIFTNRYGNHVIVQRQNELKYFRVNVNGTATDSVTIESTSVISPSITGDASIIYIVYGKSNQVTAKYSTDGGDSWNYIGTSLPNTSASWIESVMSNNKLHVTYNVSLSSYYRNFASNTWSQEYTVSSGENGVYPRIAAWNDNNDDKVYFLYKKPYTSDLKWREFNVATSGWTSDPKLAISMTGVSSAGLAVSDNLITVYYNYWDGSFWYFKWIVKNKSDNSTITTCMEWPDKSDYQILYSTVTSNFNVHVPLWYNYIYDDEHEPGIYRSNGYNCNLELVYWDNYQTQQNVNFINCSSSSNDVYVIWNDSYIGQNLRLIYDDQTPLAPQGLAVQPHQIGNTVYAKLTWQLNNEPDVFIKTNNAYEIWRRISSLGNWSIWSVVYAPGGGVSEFIDYEVQGVGTADVHTVEYKMKARDYNNHVSDFSSVVSIEFEKYSPSAPGRSGGWANKSTESSGNSISYDYDLAQNYPNPFNPATTINYSIKTAGEVTLKVYDMLGTEVASLVDERKEPGNYSVDFDAAYLPSGIYVYRLISGSFANTKKLNVLK